MTDDVVFARVCQRVRARGGGGRAHSVLSVENDVVTARVCQHVQGGLVKAQHRPCAQTDGVMIAWLCACAPGGGGAGQSLLSTGYCQCYQWVGSRRYTIQMQPGRCRRGVVH
jgi:hypothetical protein